MRGVLFVDPSPALGGAEHSLLLALEHLDRAHFRPLLAGVPGALAREARARDVAVRELPLARLRREPAAPLRLARGARALARLAREERVDLLHANTLRAAAYVLPAARLARRPWLWHVRDLDVPAPAARVLAAGADVVVAVSAAVARSLPGAPAVIANGVRPEDFAKDRGEDAVRLRRSWGVPDDAPLVGQIARLAPWKGQRPVLAAAERILGERRDAHLVLCGGDIFGDAGGYARDLERRVAASPHATRIVCAGHVDDVPAALAALDVLLHASRAEPFGRILVEAAAAGVPVAAFDGGAVPEIVAHGATGLVVAHGDTEALAAAALRLLEGGALARRLGAAARRRARDLYDVRPLTRRLEERMEAAIARR